ncbi:MAG: hypothetical protein HY526_04650 [Betaproteobacteria bacterium]|nr:hypothetical protein [Betaproteobacteria bacterium]
MSDTDLRRWADTWESAGRALDELRRRDLQAMTDDDVRRAIADLFPDKTPADPQPRTTSGLVEQQRLFAGLREPA